MRILVVEDDKMIGQAVVDALAESANAVDWVQDGEMALDVVFDAPYDCILLDLGLPKVDGLQVLDSWRRRRLKTPVIILTARDEVSSRVTGLDKGADDYVVKPFQMQELQARIRAVTRRRNGTQADTSLRYGVLSLDPVSHEVKIQKSTGEVGLSLTAREFALLEALMTRPGAVLSRDVLEQRIYSWDDEIESNAIEYIIHTLRKKIGPEFIKNVRGVGWKVNRIEEMTE